MILVDTSILIDFFKQQVNDKISLFKDILTRNIPFGISAYTYQEVLQGARDEAELQILKEYLLSQKIYFLRQEVASYERAARLFFDLRRKGITPRSTLDILIVLTALDNDLALLHNDRDFDIMAEHIPGLKIIKLVCHP